MKAIQLLSLFFLLVLTVWSQEKTGENNEKYRIMFYNVENLFDPFDDSLTNDNEFTPEGSRHWTYKKFVQKLNNTSKVIIGVGEWDPPVVVGLCEIENRFALNKLVHETPLKNFGYKIIHYDSPDRRGIDVGFLYREDRFEPVYSRAIPIRFPANPYSKTRDILYVKGILGGRDTVHFFVNHWPSRLGGYEESKPKRLFTASVLRSQVDSLIQSDVEPYIIIMGDFNDEPWDESIQSVLNAGVQLSSPVKTKLYDLMGRFKKNDATGTNKYREDWSVIDQFVITGMFLTGNAGLAIDAGGAQIYSPDFLLVDDPTYLGKKLFRTFNGFQYTGGFSDHLPVYLDIRKNGVTQDRQKKEVVQ